MASSRRHGLMWGGEYGEAAKIMLSHYEKALLISSLYEPISEELSNWEDAHSYYSSWRPFSPKYEITAVGELQAGVHFYSLPRVVCLQTSDAATLEMFLFSMRIGDNSYLLALGETQVDNDFLLKSARDCNSQLPILHAEGGISIAPIVIWGDFLFDSKRLLLIGEQERDISAIANAAKCAGHVHLKSHEESLEPWARETEKPSFYYCDPLLEIQRRE
jgi:hypothetical protein